MSLSARAAGRSLALAPGYRVFRTSIDRQLFSYFAGIAMAQNQTKSFGQGAAGFGRYYGTAFADQTIGNMMSESVFPVLLHQDPRTKLTSRGYRINTYSIIMDLLAAHHQRPLRLGDNNLPRTAAPLAADAFFAKSCATTHGTLLGLGNWQASIFGIRE